MRLAKYLAHAGVASRRAAEELIAVGRVRLDGEPVRDPARNVEARNRVEVDGRPIAGPEPRVVYAVHKPLGAVSTARDTHGRPTVVQLIPEERRRLYPVGRLDADSSGLILLTNDGALAQRLTHPRHQVPKTYRARLGGAPISDAALRRLRAGVTLADGPTAPARVRRVGRAGANVLDLTIREGRNRQVRRMCEALDHPVLSLVRTRFGGLTLDGLAVGAHRRLSEAEVERLRASASAVPEVARPRASASSEAEVERMGASASCDADRERPRTPIARERRPTPAPAATGAGPRRTSAL
ncbi:MAG TPA: pseudouridine synthase [Solirubrobacteraceae bacterium]|jgi:23S rRNA pseudouridine2605 synthase|nr:pseudouridine synthase [Solirubrobacteraceae bacterium]